MKTVPNPLGPRNLPESDDSGHPTRPVSALEAELDAAGEMIVVQFLDPGNEWPFPFALSPPAAKQLAELLEQAVEDYLHPTPQRQPSPAPMVGRRV